MSTTLITSALSVLAISMVSFATFLKIFKTKDRNVNDLSFALCWLNVSLIFLLIGVRMTVFFYGSEEAARIVAYIIQTVLVFIFINFGYYIFYLESKKKFINKFLFGVVVLSGLCFFLFLIKDGIVGPMVSEWGTEYTASMSANIFLFIAGGLGILAIIFSLIKQSYVFVVKKEINKERFFKMLSLLLFVAFGTLEQIGNVGWHVLFFRILILSSALTAYSVYVFQEKI